MREEADTRDCQLIEILDERERRTIECWTWEADRRDELRHHQMLRMVKDSRRGLTNQVHRILTDLILQLLDYLSC